MGKIRIENNLSADNFATAKQKLFMSIMPSFLEIAL